MAQVRCKRSPGRAGWEAVQDAVRVLQAAGVVALVNDRVDWALLSGADGVHVGDEEPPPPRCAGCSAPTGCGVTVRGAAGAVEAAAAGASYVGLGPVLRHPDQGGSGAGARAGAAASRGPGRSPLPVIAIGESASPR